MTVLNDSPSANSKNRAQFIATVVENRLLCREHYRLTLRLPSFPATKPGQFIQISCRDVLADEAESPDIEWEPGARIALHDQDLLSPTAMLRRPFSLAGRKDSPAGVDLVIIHRVVGIGTDWLGSLELGESVGILGPLGNSFALPAAGQTALLIGGGVGIPPMIYLAGSLSGRSAVAFSGATTRELLCLSITAEPDAGGTVPKTCLGEFSGYGIPSIVTTDDGSLGFKGFITQALEKYLDSQPRSFTPSIFTCGPELMMKRVAEIALARNIPCQIAVERAMACGMGTCQSCCIRVKKPDPAAVPLPGKDWCYRLACTDGPVFSASDLLW